MSQRLLLWLLLLNKTYLFSCWDVVVVGSGYGGATIVNELRRIFPEWTILLLEAGPDSEKERADLSIEPDVPVLCPTQQIDDYFNFKFTTKAQEDACLAMIDKKCDYTYGKGTGGSSQINSMIYSRGFPNDFNIWADDGLDGWEYVTVSDYFQYMEKLTLDEEPPSPINNDDRGDVGPYNTEFCVYRTDFAKAFFEGSASIGFTPADYNGFGRVPDICSYVQANTIKGLRQNVVKQLLTEVVGKAYGLTDAYVNKLVFKDGKIIGVHYTYEGNIYQAPVTKQVILAAGVINTPRILISSGIGPADVLSTLGITLVKDLPVGKLLSDQVAFHALTYTVNTNGETIDYGEISDNKDEYIETGGTFLAIPDGKEVVVFGRIPNSDPDVPVRPDYMIIFTPMSYASDLGRFQKKNHRLTDEFFEAVFGSLKYKDAISVSCIALHEGCKGSLKFTDKKPTTPPVIDMDVLSNPKTADVLLACVKKAKEIFNSGPFIKYNPQLFPLNIPECNALGVNSDEYWKCCFKYLAMPMKEGVGTCKMGLKTDPTTVVDPKLNVHDVEKLKIIDGSVLRNTISSQSEPTIMMMARKVALEMQEEFSSK